MNLLRKKVVFVSTPVEPKAWDIFMKLAPPDYDIEFANPNDGEDRLMEKIETADVLVAYRSNALGDEVVERAKHLKFIQSTSQGMDHIPVRAAIQKGIRVSNINGGNALAVAELSVLLTLATMRRLVACSTALRTNSYKADTTIMHQLSGKTVGLLGFGNIARQMTELLRGFNTNVIFYKRTPATEALKAQYNAKQVSFEALLKQSDVVAIHLPLSPSTRHLIGSEQLNMMKPTAFLVNTARGAVVDEAALIRALREKRIAGAGLDVFESEPPKPDNPLLFMDNVITTPHIGGIAWDNWESRMKMVWDNIQKVMNGKEPADMIRI
jgi:phosphoglycerate dehydrogenase-like enzyme